MVKCTKKQIRRLKTALGWKGHPEQRQRIQMVLLRESGMTQPTIAEAMGVSLSTVNRAHMAYDQGGLKAWRRKPSGGRKRENMTLAEEKALLTRFAKAAGAGELLNIHDLKAAYEKAIGHETSNSTVYNLLTRHGWRKGRQAWSPLAHHVRRRSALRPDEPPATVLGTHRHPARGRLPAHSRIRLFVWRSQPEGRNLRLSGHAGARYRMLPDFPRHLGEEIFQGADPACCGRSRQSPRRRTRDPHQYHPATPPALRAGVEPSGKYLGRNSGENIQELRPQIHERSQCYT